MAHVTPQTKEARGSVHPVLVPSREGEGSLDNERMDKMMESLVRIETEMKNMSLRVAKLMDTSVDRRELRAVMDRLSSLEADRNKVFWIIMTAVAGAILALVLNSPFIP